MTSEPVQSLDQDHDDVIVGGESSEEVLVEVAEEGALTEGASFVDEFRQEQQLEKTKDKISRGTCTLYACMYMCIFARYSPCRIKGVMGGVCIFIKESGTLSIPTSKEIV